MATAEQAMTPTPVGPRFALHSSTVMQDPTLSSVSALDAPYTLAHAFPAGWSLASVPMQPVDGAPAAVFHEIPPPLRLYDYVDGRTLGVGAAGFRTVAPARAFWLLLSSATTVSVSGAAVSTAEPFSIPIAPGWNTIGSPWPSPVSWSDERVSVSDGAETVPLSQALTRGWIEDLMEHNAATDIFSPVALGGGEMMPWGGYVVFSAISGHLILSTPSPDGPPIIDAPTSPAELAIIKVPTDIIGTILDDNLTSYTLAYSAKDKQQYTTFATGTVSIEDGVLGRIDPTVMENGLYDILITAEDAAGHVATKTFTYQIDGRMKVGNFSISFNDVMVPMAGIPITVVRTYDTRTRDQIGEFGHGWRLSTLSDIKLEESGEMSRDWDYLVSGGLIPVYYFQPTRPHFVTVTYADGRTEEFSLALHPSSQAAAPIGVTNPSFVAQSGTFSSLAALPQPELLPSGEPGGETEFLTLDGDLWDPDDYRLTTMEGTEYVIGQPAGLKSIRDTNGNTITIAPSGIIHSGGKSVLFVRDAQGRIASISDPEGLERTYEYDADGDLVGVTDPEGNTVRFAYDANHYLIDIIDPRGVRVARNEYDDSGRLTATIDADGNRLEFTHDIAGRQEIVKDRLGNLSVYVYDDDGNVLAKTDPLGHTSAYTYDTRGNTLTETDALGNTTTSTWSPQDRLLTRTDPLDHTTTYTYNTRGLLLTVTDPLDRVTRNEYDSRGNLIKTTDAADNVSTSTYDTAGNLLTSTDAAGKTTINTYDGSGWLLSTTDALGHLTSFTYDARGNQLSETRTRAIPGGSEAIATSSAYDAANRPVSSTDPYGAVSTTEYNPIGKPSATVNALGHRTGYEYDARGNLIRTTHADGSVEETTYDAEGHRLTSTDRDGHVTTYTYDAAGRLTRTTYADGSSTRSEYDAAGRLTKSFDARGHATSYGYDAAGRRTSVTDPLGNATAFEYDAVGNTTKVTDAVGHEVRYDYDVLGRRTKTTFADGTFTTTVYDALGRKTAETDQAGKTTQFAYDAVGRLVKVTDALGHETIYTYDELGNLLTQTDANGHATTFEVDKLGRQTRRTLPDGRFERSVFDALGNVTSKIDLLGRTTTYTYGSCGCAANGRLQSKTYPDASSVSFTYTASGRRATVVDARGTAAYGYDVRGRLASLTYPDGRRLDYAYDAAGNRTSLTTTIGGTTLTTRYTFDDANRLDLVTDPLGRSYDHGYDAVGNRASLANPNGTSTAYAYDTLNRLTGITTLGPTGTVQSYAYTLGAAGNRTRVDEADGTVRDYTYDGLYRLTSETVTGPISFLTGFTYDPVGNRLSQTRSGAIGNDTIAYTYDAADRLTQEDATAYGWDDNGNLTSNSGEAAYAYDFDNRLTRVIKADGTIVDNVYDADGNRIRTVTTVPGEPSVAVDYLVDPSGALSQVVAESVGGLVSAYYVRGDDLLALIRPAGTRFYHADGLGSIRALTDETGAVTDAYTYSAFGELVSHTGTDPQPYAFTGEPYDPNIGFQYHRARWLDPSVGRFITTDPWEGSAFEPVTLHKYLYAGNDPLGKADPTGQSFLSVSLATLNIALTVSSMAEIVMDPYTTIGQKLLRVGFDIALGATVGKVTTIGVKLGAKALARVFVKGARFKFAVASFGRATTKTYRDTFFREFPDLEGEVWVHHAVPQAVLKRYPHLHIDEFALHSIENLRGIPNEINPVVHLSQIKEMWENFYKMHKHNPTAVSVEELLEYATRIDDEFGHLFVPKWR